MKRKILIYLLAVLIILSGCYGQDVSSERYEASFLELFDTVTTMMGYAESKESFTQIAQSVYDGLEEYHKLYDIYNEYEGINNIKTINDNAGISPVKVDQKIINLLTFCKKMYYETGCTVNVCMGSVLKLWHDARTDGIYDPENARIPSQDELTKANDHTDIENLIIDEENSTVFLRDKDMRLDVGAVAKGYAVARVSEALPEGILLSVGGNVASNGPKPDGSAWVVGIQDPENAEDYVYLLNITTQCVVSSGSYQRNYMVGDTLYHHIIDPDTLMPADRYTAVSVIADDSGVCDALSTALFLLPVEEGKALSEKYGAQAIWIFADGSQIMSDGFEDYIK